MQDPAEPIDDLDSFRIPESLLASRQKVNPARAKAPRRIPKTDRLRFYQFPTEVLGDISQLAIQNATPAPLLVLFALYQLWFTSFCHNPVKLTTRGVEKYGLSRQQKYRALELLEETGHITVRRECGKNPKVTLNWLQLSE